MQNKLKKLFISFLILFGSNNAMDKVQSNFSEEKEEKIHMLGVPTSHVPVNPVLSMPIPVKQTEKKENSQIPNLLQSKPELEEKVQDVLHLVKNARENFKKINVKNIDKLEIFVDPKDKSKKELDEIKENALSHKEELDENQNVDSVTIEKISEPNFENGLWYLDLAIKKMQSKPANNKVNSIEVVNKDIKEIENIFNNIESNLTLIFEQVKAKIALLNSLKINEKEKDSKDINNHTDINIKQLGNIFESWNNIKKREIKAFAELKQEVATQAMIAKKPNIDVPKKEVEEKKSDETFTNKPIKPPLLNPKPIKIIEKPTSILKPDIKKEPELKTNGDYEKLQSDWEQAKGSEKTKLFAELQVYKIKHKMKFNLNNVDYRVGSKERIAKAIELFKDKPGAENLIKKIILQGSTNTPGNLRVAIGAAYELLMGLQLTEEGQTVIGFGSVYTSKKINRKFEYDIETNETLIECKHWNWSDNQNRKIAEIQRDFEERKNLANEQQKEFILISKEDIPERLKLWLVNKKISYSIIPKPASMYAKTFGKG
ncbi:MAG: hypothetical protein P4L22_01620 [Candidatus Babeliales bacterium]|nr:hypothetical protein [Candidatus Babeliales bacterium]